MPHGWGLVFILLCIVYGPFFISNLIERVMNDIIQRHEVLDAVWFIGLTTLPFVFVGYKVLKS